MVPGTFLPASQDSEAPESKETGMSFLLGPVLLLPSLAVSLAVFIAALVGVIAVGRRTRRTAISVFGYLLFAVLITIPLTEHASSIFDQHSYQDTPVGDNGLLYKVLWHRLNVHLVRGRRNDVDQIIKEEARVGAELRTPLGQYYPKLHAAMLDLLEGRLSGRDDLTSEHGSGGDLGSVRPQGDRGGAIFLGDAFDPEAFETGELKLHVELSAVYRDRFLGSDEPPH